MTFFLPSFFQKRILRYALSRLELLDTDALDLEKLDINWGKRSTIELRDIGVHARKVADILQLPETLVVVSAQILCLRLTIPADLYNSGILAEVQGVQVRVIANLEDQCGGGKAKSTPPKGSWSENPSKSVKTDKSKTTQFYVHDPGGELPTALAHTAGDGHGGVAEYLPTTIELAKSFLHDEPKKERSQLQDAIQKSEYLDESLATSGEDETSDLGVANTLSLPGFLADFLKGVGDRVEVNVKDVEVDLEIKLDFASESSANSDTSERPNVLTIRFYVEQITVGAISQPATPSVRERKSVQEVPTTVPHEVRHIELINLQTMLISDASLFANVARSTGLSSPETTHASIAVGSGSNPIESAVSNTINRHKRVGSSFPSNLEAQESQSPEASKINHFSQSPKHSEDYHVENKSTAQLGLFVAGDGQHDDRVLTGSLNSTCGDILRSHEEGQDHNTLPEPTLHGGAADSRASTLLSTMSNNFDDAVSPKGGRTHSATLNTFPPPSLSASDPQLGLGFDIHGQDSTRTSELPVKPRDPGRSMNPIAETLPSRSSRPGSYTISPVPEDLAESKIFSHEEAESMYMSAISHLSTQQSGKTSSIPGQWSTSSSDSSDEGRVPLCLGNDWSLQDKTTILSRQLEISANKDGLASHDGDHGGRILPFPNTDSTQHIFPLSRLPIYARNEPVSPPELPGQRDGSSQSSGASSANLKSHLITMKRILFVDFMALELPQGKTSSVDTPVGKEYHNPGASSQTLSGSLGLASQSHNAVAPEIPNSDYSSDSQKFDRWPFLNIGNIQVSSDLGLAKLMILVVEKMNALRSISSSEKSRMADPHPTPTTVSQIGMKMKRMCWKFVDVVKGAPMRAVRSRNPIEQVDLHGDSEVLLRVEIKDFCATYHKSGTTSALEISTRKLKFGYVSDDILSFDPGLKMRESTRDILAPFDNDMKLMVTRTVSATKIELTTLPLHVALDARRLDETFAWFGGFSSMIGLGSSMMSTTTVVDVAGKSSNNRRLTRGVRFEGQMQNSSKLSSPISTQNKVTARIGGLVLDLQGTRSSLRLESTAMKLVSRTEGLGLQVDRLNILGPYLQNVSSEPSTAIKLSNVRIEYLSTPKEKDLDRLLALLSPSKDEYESDDDILLDTLLRQRRQGGVVRATVESLEGVLSDLDDLECFATLSEDLKKLSTVTRYLPEDDRPGVLTLMLVRDLRLTIQVNDSFGTALLTAKRLEAAHVAFPSLAALGITTLNLDRNGTEELVGNALPAQIADEAYPPMVMARFIGNDLEPTAKIKLYNVRFEYHVPTFVAIMGMEETTSVESIVTDMVSSTVTLTTRSTDKGPAPKPPDQGPPSSDRPQGSKDLKLDIALRDSALGLNPRRSLSKGLVLLTDTHFVGAMPRGEVDAVLDIRKASLMVIDDRNRASSTVQSSVKRRSQVEAFSDRGYVSVGLISAATAKINAVKPERDSRRTVDVEMRDDLFVLETCADSTQTIQSILAGLTPPIPPRPELKYRTEVIPVEDMLASFSGDAFPATQINHDTDEELKLGFDDGDMINNEFPHNPEVGSSFYNPDLASVYEGIADSMLEDDIESLPSSSSIVQEVGNRNHRESFEQQTQIASDDAPLHFRDDHFGTSSVAGCTAHRQNALLDSELKMLGSPLRVRVRDVHFIWNLYDGYDWQNTRDTISQAIEDVQNKATERLARNDKRKPTDPDEEEESVIGDFLFNSIYIGISANRDPRELAHQVNRNLDDHVSEAESYATSTSSGSPSRKGQVPRSRGSRKLRLKRSKYHKMTFELKGVSADVKVFPPDSGDNQSSLDIRVRDLDIFDHVPTSTWKKFATYMHEAGEREIGTDMIHLEILNVKPVPNLAASEIILKATILPLRLHVDQDALDFMTRFFEFKDNLTPMQTSKSDAPFLQRVEVNSIRVKFDFKPKRIDYAGIRSGHTNEFMNFFILEQADMVLRHVIIYGVSGFDKLGKTLNDIWMPDVKGNQLPGVLAGLAPIRSLVNVGGGFRNLVAIPVREYRKDGRVVRSLQKGAVAFAKTTTSELVKLGAKLAIGTQTVLQGAEDLLTPPMRRSDANCGWEDAESGEEEKPQISAYADQPVGVVQGLRGGYASLERDLLTAKDAIIAMPGDILESGTAGGVARAVLKGAPTIILRPAMGVSNAVGQTLMGATNSLDPGNRRRIEDKYKRH